MKPSRLIDLLRLFVINYGDTEIFIDDGTHDPPTIMTITPEWWNQQSKKLSSGKGKLDERVLIIHVNGKHKEKS